MIDEHKLIEAMAEALRDNAVNIHKQIGYEKDLPAVSKLQQYKPPAKVALNALCRALPEPANKFISWEILHKENSDLYNQLKAIGNK